MYLLVSGDGRCGGGGEDTIVTPESQIVVVQLEVAVGILLIGANEGAMRAHEGSAGVDAGGLVTVILDVVHP